MLTLPLQMVAVSIQNSWVKKENSRALSKSKKVRIKTKSLDNFLLAENVSVF
jgi:hypothetical protein